ncbi:type IV pilus assembly protein PilO [Acinetobacter calcoaceticus]|uniref:Type IV pilus assembly protein PilO n=1 Tax=Acinetobacter calcoaceticus TaxID=471 RepID=A0A4R1Y0T8_ACICA|nr:type IV pilus assembly protein PilO [Acinetobacter calcoaceticus]
MKQEQFNQLEAEKVTAKKKRLTLEAFFQQFNTLDMQRYGSWPFSVKLTCWVFIFLLVGLLGYFLVVQPKIAAIDAAQAQQLNLLNEFKEKDSKLRNLKPYQTQLQQMQSSFEQQLAQLPQETEIPNLIEDLHQAGLKSGLKIKNIQLENEVQQTFFIEQPISIEAQGDYHAFGEFVSAIAALPRIVTLHDMDISVIDQAESKSEIPQVVYSIKAKTYRYTGSKPTRENQPLNAEIPGSGELQTQSSNSPSASASSSTTVKSDQAESITPQAQPTPVLQNQEPAQPQSMDQGQPEVRQHHNHSLQNAELNLHAAEIYSGRDFFTGVSA